MSVQVAATSSRSNYLDILDSAWAAHLAPRAVDAPTVISTFAGCGGSSLGYSMAGFRELLAVEWDDNAVATFALNFPDVPIYHGDIAACSVEHVLERTELTVGALDVLDGSPPCQGFSTAGKRILDDPRNQLFREFVRLLRGLQPRVFVMENVSGMVKGKMKLVFAECLRELKAAGYRVSARLMNAMYFHVPQSRQRMIFVGVREDLPVQPSHPVAQSQPITVKEAIGAIASFHNSSFQWRPMEDRPSATITKTISKAQMIVADTPVKTDTISNRRADALAPGTNHPERFSMVKLHPDRPANTIPKSVTPNGTAQLLHPSEPRIVNIAELKRLASYPDPFAFIGGFTEQWARIGNSVPPLFMRAIAQHIRSEILKAVAS